MAGSTLTDIFRIKDLRDRIIFTITMLLVYRLGSAIPIPGINPTVLRSAMMAGGSNAITDYIDFFAGGAFKNFSIFMMSIMPYISMSIIMNLLVMVFPTLKKISEEEGGRKKIQRYTRYGTVGIALIQALVVRTWANQFPQAIGINPTAFTFIAMISVVAGTMLLLWIGEQINQRGIGNGVSLLIFAGIVARMPQAFIMVIQQISNREMNPVILILVLIMFVIVVALVVYEQQGQRKIPVNYAKRVVGRRMYGAQNTYIPFKINPSGVIPVIFASAILTFPMQIAQGLAAENRVIASIANFLSPTGFPYIIIYTIVIIFFAYFYTQVTLNPQEIAKQIRENGGSIPGVRADKMEAYLTRILNRIVLPGALFLALIAVIPTLVQMTFNFPPQVAMLLGGTSLIIMVGVDLDTMSQVEAHLRMHHHDGLTKKGKLKSRTL